MKKFLLIIPALFLAGCVSEPTETASEPPVNSYSVVLDTTSSTLTSDDSTEAITVTLKAKENQNVTYQLEIGAPCYTKQVKDTEFTEIVMKQNGYFKSVSNYKVSLIRVDFFNGKGINYEIYNNVSATGEQVPAKNSTVQPVYPEDNGKVFDYEIGGNEWLIRNTSVYKPAFYSVTIFFEVW